jgi:hypothetical protein
MCDLFVYTLREMCPAVVVLGGTQSLALYYNITLRDFNPM